MTRQYLAALLALAPCLAQAATPAAVSSATSGLMADCRANNGKPSLTPGFETAVDLNGDGQPDYILDGNHLTCAGAETFFCGSGGCVSLIFFSSPGGYRRVFADNVFGFTIDKSTSPPTLRVHWHGVHCDRSGSEGCTQTLVWNGRELTAAAVTSRPRAAKPGLTSPWAIRQMAGGAPLAYIAGQGLLREFNLSCNLGKPYAGVVLREARPFAGGVLTASIGARQFEIQAQWSPQYPLTYVLDLSGSDMPRALIHSQGDLALSLKGVSLGSVPLAGAAEQFRAALSSCVRL